MIGIMQRAIISALDRRKTPGKKYGQRQSKQGKAYKAISCKRAGSAWSATGKQNRAQSNRAGRVACPVFCACRSGTGQPRRRSFTRPVSSPDSWIYMPPILPPACRIRAGPGTDPARPATPDHQTAPAQCSAHTRTPTHTGAITTAPARIGTPRTFRSGAGP